VSPGFGGPAQRLLRRDRPAPDRRTPSVAVLTVARDEKVMLPRWIDHYGREFGTDHLIVFDDNSSDGSTDDLPCTVHRIPGFPPGKFEGSRMRLVSGVARGLLETYDVVMFTDVDELIVADPARHDGLLDLLRARPDAQVLAPLALNVVHHAASEAPLDPDLPVAGQRHFAVFAPVMCKPAIKRVPDNWAIASHGVRHPYSVDPDLFMLHLKFADRDLLRAAADRRHAMVQVDKRGANTSWSRTGNDIVSVMERVAAGIDPEAVSEFDPSSIDLESLVTRAEKAWRSRPEGQIKALTTHPVVRIPERLHGLV
jgi:hypothetical protein